jgi:hypothetical protein
MSRNEEFETDSGTSRRSSSDGVALDRNGEFLTQLRPGHGFKVGQEVVLPTGIADEHPDAVASSLSSGDDDAEFMSRVSNFTHGLAYDEENDRHVVKAIHSWMYQFHQPGRPTHSEHIDHAQTMQLRNNG